MADRRSFRERYPIAVPALEATYHFSKGQLLMNLLLAVVAIPFSVYYGLIPWFQLRATIKVLLIVYLGLLLATAVYNLVRSPLRLLALNNEQIASINERLDDLADSLQSVRKLAETERAPLSLSPAPVVETGRSNLVFKGIGKLHAYSLYGYPLVEGHPSSSADSAYQVIALTVHVENEFSDLFKTIPIRGVTAQLIYYPQKGGGFQLNRGAWLGSVNRASFGVNDHHHLVIATVMGEGDERFVYAINKEYRDDQGFDKVGIVLPEDVYDVKVRVISEEQGLLHFEKWLVLTVGEVPKFRVSLRPIDEEDPDAEGNSDGATDLE